MPLGEETRIFDLLRAAEALAERLSDDQRLGRIAGYLCIHFSAMGAHDRAIVAGQRALALAISSGAVDIQVAAQSRLGQAYYTGGDFQQAQDHARRAMALLTGDLLYANFGTFVLPAVASRSYVVYCLAELGGFTEGRGLAEEAMRFPRPSSSPSVLPVCLFWLGCAPAAKGTSARRSLRLNGAWRFAKSLTSRVSSPRPLPS